MHPFLEDQVLLLQLLVLLIVFLVVLATVISCSATNFIIFIWRKYCHIFTVTPKLKPWSKTYQNLAPLIWNVCLCVNKNKLNQPGEWKKISFTKRKPLPKQLVHIRNYEDPRVYLDGNIPMSWCRTLPQWYTITPRWRDLVPILWADLRMNWKVRSSAKVERKKNWFLQIKNLDTHYSVWIFTPQVSLI